MNSLLLDNVIQDFILEHLEDDVHKIAMSKSIFPGVTAQELAGQISAKRKSAKKLPKWFNTSGIYYPPLLSIEQCSSEVTAAYKAGLSSGTTLIDLTGGFGVDAYYFSKVNESVTHCELSTELSAIAAHNGTRLQQSNTRFIAGDGLTYLASEPKFGTIYIDPARRGGTGKVFMLKDCTPNVVEHLDLLLNQGDRLMIKTAPLLDLVSGLRELKDVVAIHIVSVKNECKELIWILEKNHTGIPRIVCTSLNAQQKQFSFDFGQDALITPTTELNAGLYLYEPDVALMKSGAFNLIAKEYNLQKLHPQTHLYTSSEINKDFPGRIFRIEEVISAGTLKRQKNLKGNVIVRNYPDKAASITEKYHVRPDDLTFLIFTQATCSGKVILRSTIVQHY